MQRRDGTRFLASVTDTPVHGEQGEVCAIIGVSSDAARAAKNRGTAPEERGPLSRLAAEAPVGIFEADATGRYVYFNAVAGELLGAKAGDDWQDSVHPEE